jgi:AraC-like DNA-binding protein
VCDGVELFEAAFDQHKYERHIHETYALGFTLRGIQRFWCRGATHESAPGDVIAINPGEAHDGQSASSGGYAYRMMYLSVDLVRRIGEEARERRIDGADAPAPLRTDAVVERKLAEAWRALRHSADSLAADETLHDAVLALAVPHAARLASRRALDSSALNRVREYLCDRVDRPVRLGELAALASMSRFQLTRQFQQAFGLPLHAYHLHVRLEEAKRRLRQGEAIASVAMDLGFADQSHFHRRFRGAFGVTPGQWIRPAQEYKIHRRPAATVLACQTFRRTRNSAKKYTPASRDRG